MYSGFLKYFSCLFFHIKYTIDILDATIIYSIYIRSFRMNNLSYMNGSVMTKWLPCITMHIVNICIMQRKQYKNGEDLKLSLWPTFGVLLCSVPHTAVSYYIRYKMNTTWLCCLLSSYPTRIPLDYFLKSPHQLILWRSVLS